MSIRALHYITGDTQQAGFGWIGGSQAFPADQLPYLNHGDTILERARVDARGSQGGRREIQILSHVWEYQTGRFGRPVVINTVAAIGVGRSHAFSEYVMGVTDNVAELASPDKMIRSADGFTMLDVDTFMNLQGNNEISSEEDIWDPDQIPELTEEETDSDLDESWRLALLSHYWKQASIRAFSADTPTTVRVCLGEFSDDPVEDTEETIRRAKRFFSRFIACALPKQVQNIASMSAGVNCADDNTLYTALEFDVSRNMFEDETLQLRRQRELRGYRLNEVEMDFMTEVLSGKTPAAVQSFFERYRELAERQEAAETEIPFMADYRVWYLVYCADRIAKEKHSFIEKAGLMNEHGNPKKIRDARACFLLLSNLRRVLSEDHQEEMRVTKGLVTNLMAPLEAALLKVMREDMHSTGAEPFLLRRNEMIRFHRDYLYNAPDEQLEDLRDLAVQDQMVSKAPQFVRCYPETPLRTVEADQRNADLMKELLAKVIRPLIEEDKKRGTVENKYLDELRSDVFADKWAAQNQNENTRSAMMEFLRQEIQDAQNHFLLYKISLKYLPGDELLKTTLKHFTEQYASPASRPEERLIRIAAYGAREFIAPENRANPECISAMNQYYRACFREYREKIGGISDIVKELGGDTSEAMAEIFRDAASGRRMTPEETEAVLNTFGGEDNKWVRDNVAAAFTEMLSAQRTAMLQEADTDASRTGMVRWIAGMVEKVPFPVDTTETMSMIFIKAAIGNRMTPEGAETIFNLLGGRDGQLAKSDIVQSAYNMMLSTQRDAMLQEKETDLDTSREGLVRWIAGMVEKAPFDVDTSDTIKAVLESARTGPRMTRASAEDVFSKLINHAANKDEKVKPAFTAMVRDQLDSALQQNDDSVLDWIGSMISVSSGNINFDTTDSLKKIFEAAKTGERMRPADARTIFETMSATAESLHTTVQRSFTEMLAARRKEAREKQDVETFDWLCEMADRSPWRDDAEWQAEQHTENTLLLCDLTSATERPADNTMLTTIQSWVDQGSIRPVGITRLQRYCNDWLEKEDAGPTELLLRSFDRIDDSCNVLRDRIFKQVKQRFTEELERPGVSFGDLIASCQADTEKSGRKLNDLYDETKEQTAEFLRQHFENTTDLGYLISEQEQIPENTRFLAAWQEQLGGQIYGQQIELFNRQPNLEKLKELRTNMLKRSKEMNPALKAAYELLDGYEGKLTELSERSEYELISGMSGDLQWINGKLDRAADVRKVLCSSLRNVDYPIRKTLQQKSFRHALSEAIMRAELTDTARSGEEKGCPDWDRVLKSMFTKAELDEATSKPFAKKNLGVLQRLLAAVDTVRLMSAYGMSESWGKDLIRTIHTNQDLHRYQNALAHNKKMCGQLNLEFDNDGLVFDMRSL